MNVKGKCEEHRAWGPECTRTEVAAEPLTMQETVTGYALE